MKGSIGKVLFINLSAGSIKEETLSENIYRDFIGGYGITAKIMHDRMPAKVNPLGPDNMLCFMCGLLNGIPVSLTSRSVVSAKSPLTGTIGESNVGGYFGVELKRAGYDGIFITGKSTKPVYLWVSNDEVKLKDAGHLWGKDTVETEDVLLEELKRGGRCRVLCIGPAGENKSLISSIMHDKGRAAGRSGLGAVMGAKNLKAIAVRGTKPIEVADDKLVKSLGKAINKNIRDCDDMKWATDYGTCGNVTVDVVTGAAPVKHWSMFGEEAFPNHEKITGPEVIKYQTKKYGCYHCAVACGGYVEVKDGPYAVNKAKKPEYESLASLGTNCFIENLEALIKSNDICNRAGIDTISAGTTVAFAMECYERGIITQKDLDGLELTWGNADAQIALLEKMIKREECGAVFADGSSKAAEKIGQDSMELATGFRGQEPGNFDPRVQPARLVFYAFDPAPGRHTHGTFASYCERFGNYLGTYPELDTPEVELYDFQNEHKGRIYAISSSYHRLMNAAGVCFFCMELHDYPLIELIGAAAGWKFTAAEGIKAGRRIQTMRQLFNIREGLSIKDIKIPKKFREPYQIGPAAGVIVDYDALRRSIR